MTKDIPEISLQRLPVYLNYLKSLPEGDKYISSGAIAAALGMGEVLVRKDLAYTSSSGRPKVGYVRTELIAAIEEYLGCDKRKPPCSSASAGWAARSWATADSANTA